MGQKEICPRQLLLTPVCTASLNFRTMACDCEIAAGPRVPVLGSIALGGIKLSKSGTGASLSDFGATRTSTPEKSAEAPHFVPLLMAIFESVGTGTRVPATVRLIGTFDPPGCAVPASVEKYWLWKMPRGCVRSASIFWILRNLEKHGERA